MSFTEYIWNQTDRKRVLLATDIHYCSQTWPGVALTTAERMDHLCQALQEAYESRPYDMILCLGDYSLDFWQYPPYGSYLHVPPVSNTKNFVQEVASRFPVKPFLIAGNHEQYGPEKWEELTGFPRQYAIVYGDNVFLMCDTFGGNLDPTENSDGTYTGLDPDFLREALARYSGKRIMICAHDLCPELEQEEAAELIRQNSNIVCAFAGHLHHAQTVLLNESWRNLPVFYCGDYSYSAPWYGHSNSGYRIVELSERFSTEFIRTVF